jgi:hypothetical protein
MCRKKLMGNWHICFTITVRFLVQSLMTGLSVKIVNKCSEGKEASQ